LLGSPSLELDGRPVKFERRKTVALVAYLAVTAETHSREALAALFWPALDQSRALSGLRLTLSTLKRALGERWLEIERDCLAVRTGRDGFWLDVDHFHDLLDACQKHGHPPERVCSACLSFLTEAVDLCRGAFMAGFSLRDCPTFDDWQAFQGQRLNGTLCHALKKIVRGYGAQKAFDRAIPYAQRWLSIEPLSEAAHRTLMGLYAQTGCREAALRQYEICARRLERELGVAPGEETAHLHDDILKRGSPAPAFETDLASPQMPHGVPFYPTPFLGRSSELAKIAQSLEDPACRTLTLIGVGGVGKSRLAAQAAAQAVGNFAHGVYYIPLAALNSPTLLASTIVHSLGLFLHGGTSPVEQLLGYLREKEMLLVLDNFEHLLPFGQDRGSGTDTGISDAAELLVKLLEHALGLKFLITSRRPLALKWESTLVVQGLGLPSDAAEDTAERCDAVRLFVQSARRVRPGFQLGGEERPSAIHICRFLGGLPLGIEMAATWLQALSCQEIAQKIEQGPALLSTHSQDIPERHRSLQTVFDDSWKLLTEKERRVCRGLSAFRGGFHGEAVAENVAGATLPILFALMRKSFIHRTPRGRYEMLEILRCYVEEKLEDEEKRRVHDAHCRYYADYVYRRERCVDGEDQQKALGEIQADIGNVRAAWRWAVAQGRLEAIDKSLESLCFLHQVRGWFEEGRALFEMAASRLEEMGDVPAEGNRSKDAVLARVLARQARLCVPLSLYEKADSLLRTSLGIFRRLGMQRESASALYYLGLVAYCLGEYARAQDLYRESLAICEELAYLPGAARSLVHLGVIASHQGEHAAARQLCQKSMAIFLETGDRLETARCLGNMGLVAAASKEHAEAERLHRESLTMFEEIGDQLAIAKCYHNMGAAVRAQGDHRKARHLYQQSLAIAESLGDRWGIASNSIGLGFTLSNIGEGREAKERFQKALETAASLGVTPMIHESLLGLAALLAQTGDIAKALEITAYLRHCQAVQGEQVQALVEDLFDRLAPQLAPNQLAQIEARAQARDIEHYIDVCRGR